MPNQIRLRKKVDLSISSKNIERDKPTAQCLKPRSILSRCPLAIHASSLPVSPHRNVFERIIILAVF